MKHFAFLVFLFIIGYTPQAQENAVELKVTFKPFKNEYIYLGYHYGKQNPIIDSVMLDEHSLGIFKRPKPLEKGVYLIGFPKKLGYFEILVDKEQKFSIFADTVNLLASLRFEGSPDNDLFLDYQNFTANKARVIEEARSRLAEAKTRADSAKWKSVIEENGIEIRQYREDLIKKYPDCTICALLKAMKEPDVPPADQQPGGKYDSLFAYRYYKDHYWDGTYFYDERLARTSFFEEKLDKYFEQLVAPDPDSVIAELDWMLGYASINEEMQRFLLVKFVNRYLNQKYMWEDRVFVYLFEKYFSEKTYPWLTEKGKKIIFDRAYSLMANLFGSQVSDINLPDSTGKNRSLYAVNSPYTVVLFWDPTCGHCKETLPRIDSIYRAKWESEHVKIYAVAKETDGSKKEWLNFVNDHHLSGWEHVYYSRADHEARINNNIPSYYQLFDVQTVPSLYLLDKDKRVLAKKIPFEQIDQVLDIKLKGK